MRICDMVMNGSIPPVIDHEKIDTIITHSANFHADDVAIVALIKECHNPNVRVIRVKDVSEYEAGNGVLIADIGEQYDGEWFYDHHQIEWRSPEECRSSIGLFWDDCGNQQLYYKLNPFIREIDRHDTLGEKIYKSQLCFAIADMNPQWDSRSNEAFDANFNAAVDLMSVLIRARISANLALIRAENYIDTNVKIEKGVMYLDKAVPFREYVNKHKYEIKAVVSPHGRQGGYNCYAINGQFPAKWLNDDEKPYGIMWIHRGGRFMCECDNMETVRYAIDNIVPIK